jgi:hypothetical protein
MVNQTGTICVDTLENYFKKTVFESFKIPQKLLSSQINYFRSIEKTPHDDDKHTRFLFTRFC